MSELANLLFRLKGQATHLVKANSPSILAALGVSGTIATGYFANKAGMAAARLIDKTESEFERSLDNKEKLELVWREYIPTGLTGTMAVSSIIAATAVGNRRTAAMAAAWALSDKALGEYKDKVVEKFGEKKEQDVRDEVVQDRVTNNPPPSSSVIVGKGEVLCLELFTGKYFMSSMESLRKAQNDINAKLLREMYVPLSEFYYLLNIHERSTMSENVGWEADRQMELEFSSALGPDGVPCLALDYNYVKSL
jgi:hypothetical protein